MIPFIKYGRKRSGIRHELQSQLKYWLQSIDDKEVRKAAKQDVIVTGGAIASMLLGEAVNDYDLYFRTRKTTIMVARYYVDKFNEKNPIKEKEGAISYTPTVKAYDDRVKIEMKSAGVAGEDQGDYHYSEYTPDQAMEFTATLLKDKKKNRGKYRPICMTDNAITLANDIQIIVRFFGEPKEIHANYDFVHATCYWDHAKKKLKLPAAALEAMLSRSLVYCGGLYPVASIFRMKKFLLRGWRINAGNQLKIMLQISELELDNFGVLQEQLIGVDVAYMHELLHLIKDENPEKIDSSYLSNLIDKVFE